MSDVNGILQSSQINMTHRLVHMADRMNLRETPSQAPHPEVTIPPMGPKDGTRDGERSALEGGRRLIVGCDGTWVNSDESASIPSNVTRLCRALNTNTPTSPATPRFKTQIIYYHRGIGTDGSLESKYVGGGTGSELSEHARECYGFICNNYQPGDEIFLFGFSRGAYTARAVSMLINDVGLLTAKGMDWFYEIFEDWKNQNMPNLKQDGKPVTAGAFKGMAKRPAMPSEEYKEELRKRGYNRPRVPIKAVGVWDTVGALGIPPILGLHVSETELLQYSFVNTKVAQCVIHAFQALGLDEHRAAFSPTVWETPDQPSRLRSLRQVWFPGVHCNVGGAGGYEDQGLSNITLAWMVEQLEATEDGLLDFDEEYLTWVFAQNEGHCREVYGPGGYRGWGMGRIEETLTTAYSLVGAHKQFVQAKGLTDWLHPGDVARTPGRYEEYEAKDGQTQSTGVLLKGTNEMIHPCVRIRVSGGGKGVINAKKVEESTYQPRGLQGWEIVSLADGAKSGPSRLLDAKAGGFAWRAKDNGQVLAEAELGRFEKLMLGQSEAVVRVTTSKA